MSDFRNYSPTLRVEFAEYKQAVLAGTVCFFVALVRMFLRPCCRQDDGFGLLMTKLRAALAADAFENEVVVK